MHKTNVFPNNNQYWLQCQKVLLAAKPILQHKGDNHERNNLHQSCGMYRGQQA